MSGGSMDYLYLKVENVEFSTNTPLRRAFMAHLKLVAKALHEIEWVDSGDGGDEDSAIRACLNKRAPLQAAIDAAREAMDSLSSEIDKAEKV